MEVVGIDGCKKGWVAIHLVDGMFHRLRLCPSLAEAVDVVAAAAVTVDIPLGLVRSGWRECDLRVPRMLGPRWNTVFRLPPRNVVETGGFDAANALCKQVMGQGLSRQTYSLFPKVLEADVLRHAGVHHLYEVHPELSFRTMAGEPLAFSKKTWNGQRLRERLLADAGARLPEDLGSGGKAAVDDVLDAAAAAWTAHRIAAGRPCPAPTLQNATNKGSRSRCGADPVPPCGFSTARGRRLDRVRPGQSRSWHGWPGKGVIALRTGPSASASGILSLLAALPDRTEHAANRG